MAFSSKKFARSLFKIAIQCPEKEKIFLEQLIFFCSQKNLFCYLPSILKNLEKEYERYQKDQQIIIKSKSELSEEIIEKIKKYVGATNNTITKKIAMEELHGGFLVIYKNKIYDGSISRQLEKLKEKMANN